MAYVLQYQYIMFYCAIVCNLSAYLFHSLPASQMQGVEQLEQKERVFYKTLNIGCINAIFLYYIAYILYLYILLFLLFHLFHIV